MMELAKKSGRRDVFRDISGCAYSYLDARGDMYVPGANDTIIRIPIRDRQIVEDDGSGTTLTLVGDEHVIIVDNDPEQVNLLAFSQKDGTLISKIPLFEPGKGAVENSVVAYGNHLVVGNTYGYTDPFVENPTAGGIMRIDFGEESGTYAPVEGWPATGHFDAKTATPKLSTSRGLIYVYTRAEEAVDGHHDWQLTAVDFRTGWLVFSIKGYFNKREFKDNVARVTIRGSLGVKHYDREVFNNLWGTFTFGPNNTLYIGAYRGFVRFQSGSALGEDN